MNATHVTWLHISDFHFRADGDKFSQQQAARALLESIRAEQNREMSPTFAVVTGDVAFSGLETEYRDALGFLAELSTISGVVPANFYFVPGNHDVDRRKQELAFHGARARINSPQQVDYYLAETDRIEPLMQRQAAFWSFVEEFTRGQERFFTPDGLSYVSKLDVGPVTICIMGMNSAWMAGSDGEEMKLVIGERQVINALEMSGRLKPHFLLALAHHPVALLTEWDSVSCRSRLLPAADFYLRGHLHAHEVTLTSSPARPCIEIAAGSGHATRFYENSYNFASIDLRTATCTVQEYRYRPADVRFEATERMSAALAVRGSMPGSAAVLADAIRSKVPDAASFARYMAGLLSERLNEIPVLVDGTVQFMAPSMAKHFSSEGAQETIETAFLGLRNLLRLYDAETPLDVRIGEHVATIRAYAIHLGSLISVDPSSQPRLQEDDAVVRSPALNGSEQSWSQRLMDDIRLSRDWAELEIRARLLIDSADPATRRVARSSLAEALMHSDEAQKREEALRIARELVAADDASDDEVVLAAAAAEVCEDYVAARRFVADAFTAGRATPELVAYGRSLATRTGDVMLRELAEQAQSRSRRDSS